VVFGDIGTSPLYTLKTVLDLTGGATPAAVLGVLSLIVWTLIAITSIKYVTIAMRIDNDGEGGVLALMARLADEGSLQCSESLTCEQFWAIIPYLTQGQNPSTAMRDRLAQVRHERTFQMQCNMASWRSAMCCCCNACDHRPEEHI